MRAIPSGMTGEHLLIQIRGNQVTRRLGKTSHHRMRMLIRFCDAGNVTVKPSRRWMKDQMKGQNPFVVTNRKKRDFTPYLSK